LRVAPREREESFTDLSRGKQILGVRRVASPPIRMLVDRTGEIGLLVKRERIQKHSAKIRNDRVAM